MTHELSPSADEHLVPAWRWSSRRSMQLALLSIIVALVLLLLAIPSSIEYTMVARGWLFAEPWGT